MTPKDPFLEGTFWDKFWRPIRSRRFCSLPNLISALISVIPVRVISDFARLFLDLIPPENTL